MPRCSPASPCTLRLKDALRRGSQQPYVDAIARELERRQANAIILSNRTYLFALPQLRRRWRVVVSWCDSFVLAFWRQLALEIRRGGWRAAARHARYLLPELGSESYYPRFAHANLMVSPVDRAVMERISGPPVQHLRLGVDVVTPPAWRPKRRAGWCFPA